MVGPCRPPTSPSLLFFNDTATTEIYTLSLHDALPIWPGFSAPCAGGTPWPVDSADGLRPPSMTTGPLTASSLSISFMLDFIMPASGRTNRCPRKPGAARSEEHTSELQSRQYLVCRLLLEK